MDYTLKRQPSAREDVKTTKRIVALGLIGLLLHPMVANAAAEVVVVSPTVDDSSAPATAIASSVRTAVLDHPWLELVDIDVALGGSKASRDALQRADRELRLARSKFDDLLIEDAAKIVKGAVQLYRDNFAHLTDPRRLGQALQLQGAIALLNNDTKTATEAIQDALALDPDAAPAPELYNPPSIKKWQQIASHYNAQKKQQLVVEDAAGSPGVVEIDGHYRGLTPFTLKAALPGNHYIRVTRADSSRWARIVAVDKKPVRVKPELPKLATATSLAEARTKAWSDDDTTQKQGVAELARLLNTDYVVLVSTTARDGQATAALTPVRAELYGRSKERIMRSAEAALGVRPGSAPPLARTFVDAVLPGSPKITVAGILPEANESETVADLKRNFATIVRGATGTNPPTAPALAPPCPTDAACMAQVRADSDAIMTFVVAKDAITLTSYVETKEVASTKITRDRDVDTKLRSAVADHVNLVWLAADDLRIAREALAANAPDTRQDDPLGLRAGAPPPGKTRRTVGLITAGAGAALAIGGFTLASVKGGVLNDPDSTGSAKESAKSLGKVGLITGIVGVVAMGVGGYLYFTAPNAPSAETDLGEAAP